MNQAFDPTSVRRTLRKGVEAGYWTVEDLDTPSMHWQENAKIFRLHNPNAPQPQYKNLLREPEPSQPPAPRVETVSPRDFPASYDF